MSYGANLLSTETIQSSLYVCSGRRETPCAPSVFALTVSQEPSKLIYVTT